MAEEKIYEVIVATPAQIRYRNTTLSYLTQQYTEQRVSEIDQQLTAESNTLSKFPHRGRKEEYLSRLKAEFRYILYKSNKGLEIKIIYLIDEKFIKVYITDFFPTKMDPENIM